ncbi:MAG: hypothetical protein KKH44_07700 [Bacteroidetes bacterium]|nr:hypothetical protein [Bacteroidota bacterium]
MANERRVALTVTEIIRSALNKTLNKRIYQTMKCYNKKRPDITSACLLSDLLCLPAAEEGRRKKMARLSKEEKLRLAEKCLNELTELGIAITVDGDWIKLSNTAKIPAQILTDLGKCNKEFAKLLA